MRGQVNEHPRVQLDVGVDRADVHGAVFDHLRDAHALGPGVCQIELGRDAAFEEVEVLLPGNRRDEHVQAIEAFRVAVGQRPRQEIGLLLVVAV